MTGNSGQDGETRAVGDLTPAVQAAILDRLGDLAPSVLTGVSRIARIALTGADGEVLVIVAVMTDGQVTFASDDVAGDHTLGIAVPWTAARSVGRGDELLEDAFAAGALTLERSIPDDFRLAPLLELLFEALVDTGVLAGAGGDDGPALPDGRRLSAFADVDRSGIAPGLLRYLEQSGRQLAGVRGRMSAALAARPGDRILDVGCGIGDEVASLAARGVIAVGADRSADMAAAARRRAAAAGQRAAVVQADGHALPFAPGAFDGCRIERVMQHVEAPARVAAELRRVVRPGGGVVAYEPDWGSLTFRSADPAAALAIATAVGAARRSPEAGRQLADLLTEAGFGRVRCETDTAVWPSLADLERTIPIAAAIRQAAAAGAVSAASGAAWMAEQKQRSAAGQFRASLDLVIAWAPIAAR